MAYYALIAPKQQWIDANGNPLSGAKLFTYSAGTSTKKTTYTDDTGGVANSNPIVLNSAGQCPSGVYGSAGAYKLVLAPSTDTDPPLSPIWTQDGVAGINDVAASTPDEWIASGFTPTYISATSFSVAGDQTGTFQIGRRIKATLSGSTRYGRISSSSFGAGITTVVVALDTGSLDATISSVSYGLISVTNSSLIQRAGMVVQAVEATPYTTYTNVSVVIPGDDTIPQNTEGVQLCTATITPTNASNRLIIEWTCVGTINAVGFGTSAIFQDATANALAATCLGAAAGTTLNLSGRHEMAAGTTSATTFALRAGPSAGATNLYVNGNAGSRLMGGVQAARLRVREVAG